MTDDPFSQLGSRERQIMTILYQHGLASASDVHRELADPPSYSTVRAMLVHLEGKGLVRHEQQGSRYIYAPTISQATAQSAALKQMLKTFFGGSPMSVVAALIADRRLTSKERSDLMVLLEDPAANKTDQ